MQLTGTSTLADAWRAIIPNYQSGQVVAIKASFNNAESCSNDNGNIDSVAEPVKAVIRGLKAIGVAEGGIWIYDATRPILNRFVTSCQNPYSGVKFYDSPNGCHTTAAFGSATINFSPPSGSVPTEYIPDLLLQVHHLINMPIMKDHGIAGVSLGFKNHFGTIDNPDRLHEYVRPGGTYYRTDYNPLVDIYKNANIGGKTRLTVADGLFASKHASGPPELWQSFGNKPPNSLFFARDPVAIDCVMYDLLAAEDYDRNGDRYLYLASQQGLGVFERGNPWANPPSSGYSKINYQKVEL
jgi:hypothetical protein